MTTLEIVLAAFCLLFVVSNALCINALRRARKEKPMDYTAESLLHDITRGNALVRIERIEPADVLLRSVRR